MAVTPFPIGLPTGMPIDALRERAKDLLKSVQAGEAHALDRIEPYFRDPAEATLQRVQLVIAREHGFSSWRRLKEFAQARDELVKEKRKVGPPGTTTFDHKKALEQAAVINPIVQRMANSITGDVTDPTVRFCHFCFKSQHQVAKFIAGTNNYICDECVERATDLFQSDEDRENRDIGDDLRCDFCLKHAREVVNVVAGGGSSICNECLELCGEIIADASPDPG